MSGASVNEETRAKQACAACKYQRKKCSQDTCMLYPYFPEEKTQDFNAVHKYFGVSNFLMKHIKKLAVEEREITVNSFVWAAMAWNQNPYTGPLGPYMDLVQEYHRTKQENQRLKQEIQELKTSTNHGKTENPGVESSVNGNYSALVRVPIEDVTNSDSMPINCDKGNGIYCDGQGGLDPNFGNVRQRFSPGGMDYQRADIAKQMEITHNTARERDVGFVPYNVSDGLWSL